MDNNLSLYHLFHVVAKHGGVSKAANELYISQPAISKAIQKLESNLNTTLFIRSSRGMRLTEEGKLLYTHTRKAFDALMEGEAALSSIRSLEIGHIRIGVSTTLCKYLLLPFLKDFVGRYPHIKISIQCQSSSHTYRLLGEGKLDVGLVGYMERYKGIRFTELGEVEDVFVATASYIDNLKLREGIGDESILSHANLMLLDEENISRKYVESYFAENQLEQNQVLEISNMDLLIEFSKIGLGAACVIKQFVSNEIKEGTLVEVPLPYRIPKRTVGIVYTKDGLKRDSVMKFLDFLSQSGHFLTVDSLN